jgi:hypothetical protein
VRNQSTLVVRGEVVGGSNWRTADLARLAVERATLVIDGGSLFYDGMQTSPLDYVVLRVSL